MNMIGYCTGGDMPCEPEKPFCEDCGTEMTANASTAPDAVGDLEDRHREMENWHSQFDYDENGFVTLKNKDTEGHVYIPDDAKGIADFAFENCQGITGVTIPDSVTKIGGWAFCGCEHLTDITIPNSVTCIDCSAFEDCSGLTGIILPDGVTSIGNMAFQNCTGLEHITIPNSVKVIGYEAFFNCKSLTSVTIPSRLPLIDDWTFCKCEYLTDISIPNSVTSIGSEAFSECRSLTSITIPDSVTCIGDWAFDGCKALTSMTIPQNVNYIGDLVFSNCDSLVSITVAKGNQTYHAVDNCLIETARQALIAGCKASVIPADGSVTCIGYGAFARCPDLTSITIPESVTRIEEKAFDGCENLKSIYYGGTKEQWRFLDVGQLEPGTIIYCADGTL